MMPGSRKVRMIFVMREKIARVMQGRYGVDSLSKFLLACGLAAVFGAALFDNVLISSLCNLLGWGFVIYCYFRLFSRNVTKRYAENQAFLTKTYKIRCFFYRQKDILKQRRVYHIYKCPNCKQRIRIPRGKGKIEVRCPKCSTTFIKKS